MGSLDTNKDQRAQATRQFTRNNEKGIVQATCGVIQHRTSRCEVAGQLGLPHLIERLLDGSAAVQRLHTANSAGTSPKRERHGIRALLRQIEACYACPAGYAKLEALVVVMTTSLVGFGLLGHDVASWAGALVHQVVGGISGGVL